MLCKKLFLYTFQSYQLLNILMKIGILIVYCILALLLGGEVAHGQSPDDDDHGREQEEPHREEEEEPQREDIPQSPDHIGSPGSQDTGYETNPDREFLEEGADAMLYYPARDLPNDQLERYRADSRDMREDMVDEMDDATKQEVDDRIRALDNEAARRGITTEQHNNSNNNNSNNNNSNNS
jgi:hypothetical protein